MPERTVAKIKKENLIHNLNILKSKLAQNCRLMAVVKADAYGHGAVECAKTLAENGVKHFAVATFNEAVELRIGGIKGDILIFCEPQPDETAIASSLNIISTVFSSEKAEQLNEFTKGSIRVHIKIDTGMSRAGIYCHTRDDVEAAAAEVARIHQCKKLSIEGIYTHFSSADDITSDVTDSQFTAFNALLGKLKQMSIPTGIRHICASSGILYYPQYHLDMVRAGIALYGYSPKPGDEYSQLFKPVMQLEAHIVHITKLKPYDCVSYGRAYTSACDMKVATVTIGYGDGYNRSLSNVDYMLVGGKKAPICGRVCMDITVIDVTDIDCKIGDTAIVFGEAKPADIIAKKLNTISYEVLCNIGKRFKRTYQ